MVTSRRTNPELTSIAWQRGLLQYKLYEYQLPVYNAVWNAIKTGNHLKYVINCARRFGKSFTLCLVSIEYAMRHPNSQIRFACPTAKQLRRFIFPIFQTILADCPPDLLPKFNQKDDYYTFPNGSQIYLAGTDNGHSESLRGTASHLNIVDEAGSCDDLKYVVGSILLPQTITTGGITLLASTPARYTDHEYTQIAHEAREEGAFIQLTVYDNKVLTKEMIDKYAKEEGGYNSITFRREYLCEFVTENDILVIPEWQGQTAIEPQIDDYYRYYHKYVAVDIGVRDFTAVLFGYYDFRRATLVIEDEYTINGPEMTTDKLAQMIRDKEEELWGDLPTLANQQQVRKRIADNNNLILVNDLITLHNLSIVPTSKDTLIAMVNETRMMVGNMKLEVSSKCVQLLGCLEHAIWRKENGRSTEFARSKKYGHYDHLAALIYLVRNLDTNTNPVPMTHGASANTHFIPKEMYYNQSTDVSELSKAFRRRNR